MAETTKLPGTQQSFDLCPTRKKLRLRDSPAPKKTYVPLMVNQFLTRHGNFAPATTGEQVFIPNSACGKRAGTNHFSSRRRSQTNHQILEIISGF